MTFAVGDFNDLKQLLVEHPQWRVELRNLLLSEDFEALPGIVRELAEAQCRTEERLTRLEEVVVQLAEAQRRTEERLTRLEEVVVQLAEAQCRTEVRLEELAEAQRRTEERLTRLEEVVVQLAEAQCRTEERLGKVYDRVDTMDVKLGRLIGQGLEIDYERKAPAYFGRWLRRAEVVQRNEVEDLLEGHLSDEEVHDALLTDLFVRGRVRKGPDKPQIWLAVEVSSVVDREDVARAVRRAELLHRAGLDAVPVVAGPTATEGAESEACDRCVAMLSDGVGRLWDQAFATWGVSSSSGQA